MKNRTELYATVLAVSETIREMGAIPAGHLFNALMVKHPQTTADRFQQILDALIRARLIEQKNNLLRWIGPELPGVEKL